MIFRDSRLVRQPCENCISIIEGDFQDTVKVPLGEFCDRGHAIDAAADRMAGGPCKSTHVELDAPFGAVQLVVKSVLM
jgi:hypothetical protein